MKTVGVALVLALNIGTDPPGLHKPTPCAKLQCWLDPASVSRAKAKERIGERLEQQYAKWQQRSKLKYRRAIDPTVETVKELCLKMRESAKNERVLFHYNGHGVPRPTANGEIWLFDRHHTNYIPLSVLDLRRWIGKPSIVVLDCSGAGQLLPYFTSPLENSGGDFGPPSSSQQGAATTAAATTTPSFHRASSSANTIQSSDPSSSDPQEAEYQAIRDTIVLCPTSQGEWLPFNPELPADVFTSCLTTPIPIALRWFVFQNPLSMEHIDLETIADSIPGKLTDRKTPLGELNWIFTAVTDTIAWNVLPGPLFQRLFRQDLLVASMFRNFLLAERILRSLNCTPVSHPEIPSTCNHPLWDAWDLAVETCLYQLIDQGYLRKTSVNYTSGEDGDESTDNNTNAQASTTKHEPQPPVTIPTADAPFFGEQLTAFEIWLEYANTKPKSKLVIRSPPSAGTPLPYLWSDSAKSLNTNPHEMDPPTELPIVLQVLLSQAHRVRALVLLKRFLELGPSAVNLALSVGIFPYVLKLLQSPIDEYKHVLIGIWARIIQFDESCRVDVVKDRALTHFIRHLNWGLTNPKKDAPFDEDACEQRTMAAFILSVVCCDYALGQTECISQRLHLECGTVLLSLNSEVDNEKSQLERDLSALFRTWLCICLGNLTKNNAAAQSEVLASNVHHRLTDRLDDHAAVVRASACYALSCIIGSAPINLVSSLAEPPTLHQSTSIPSFGNVSGMFNPSSLPLTPSILQPSFSQGLQPGMNYLAPGNDQPTLFGGSMATGAPPQPEIRTVFDDQQRLNADTDIAVRLSNILDDACPVVRFEALLALNRFIAKYIDGLVWVAEENGSSSQRTIMSGLNPSIPLPQGMNADTEASFSGIWKTILKHYRCEPQPLARSLLTSIVSSVNERVIAVQSKLRQRRTTFRRQYNSMIDENTDDVNDETFVPLPSSTQRLNQTPSLYGSPQSFQHSSSPWSITPPQGQYTSSALQFDLGFEDLPCPESMFYHWKRVEFADRSVDVGKRHELDLLSDVGAIKKYQLNRNTLVQQKGQLLRDSFAVLAQAQPQRQSSDPPYADNIRSEIDEDIEARKQATHLKQISVLRNTSSRGQTRLLNFHPYEPLLVCGGADDITCWNAETSEKMVNFSNENPKNTRMTAATWINEESTSLFLTGCSDGSVRIYDGLLYPNDEISRHKPTLVSSFFALKNTSSEKGATGLILDYQSYNGHLVTGGSTKQMKCWDIESERCFNSYDHGSDAMLTTLESPWKYSYRDGYVGLGPDVVIAGFSNGALKLYDTRANNGTPAMNIARNDTSRKRIKYSELNEHNSWIVNLSFFAGRQEVISGDVSGNIKYWDLRYSSSTRTLKHKMLMTALTVHNNIPLIATGSPAQFIKMISYDGSTQQVIRYHGQIPGQRIGPVSCLSFHPQMPYLAAGFSDDVVSVYAPGQLSQ